MYISSGGNMSGVIETISRWIKLFYGDGFFVLLAVFAYVYLFFCVKETRKRILFPVLLLCVVVFNPILYKYIFYRIIYWRLFWMLPNSIAIAYAVVKLLQDKSVIKKGIILGVFSVMLVVKGTNVFDNGGFGPIQNVYKIADEVVEVCDVVLALDESPRCIMPSPLYCEVRQYSGDIELMYGRDIEGYINSREVKQEFRDVHAELVKEIPNYDYVLSVAKDNGYDFVIVDHNKPITNNVLEVYGYVLISSSDAFDIYRYMANERTWTITQYPSTS